MGRVQIVRVCGRGRESGGRNKERERATAERGCKGIGRIAGGREGGCHKRIYAILNVYSSVGT